MLFRGPQIGLAVALSLLLGACAYFDRDGQREVLFKAAQAEAWTSATVPAPPFSLFTMSKGAKPAAVLTVYIEGDGRAWLNRTTPSDDPTPERPVALRLAVADASTNVAYIARPCQFIDDRARRACNPRYWTSHRYAPEVIEALSTAIDSAKTRSGSRQIELIGYSGGGAAAALIAARRTDVVRLTTVAANLDLAAWTRTLKVDPMPESLDPALEAGRTASIPQYHLAGRDDETVPPQVVRSYAARASMPGVARIVEEVPGYSHDCCWHRDWAQRISAIRARLEARGGGS